MVGLKPVYYTSLLGVAGVTAWYGLVDILKVASNDTVVVSGAAGAVKSLAVQIAKIVLSCKKTIGTYRTDAE